MKLHAAAGVFVLASLLAFGAATGQVDDASPEGEASQADDREVVDLTGTWRADYVTTTRVRIAVVGRFSTTATATLAVELEQEGQELEMSTRICSFDMETTLPMADTVVPEAFADVIPDEQRTARVRPVGDELEFVAPRHWNLLGVRLDDPASEELPDDKSDPRVFDQDGDGNPGATIRIEGIISGDIYVIQRGWDEWRGTVVDDDTIEGHVVWMTDQEVLDATHRFLRRQPDGEAHPDRDKNTFRMQRVDGEPPC